MQTTRILLANTTYAYYLRMYDHNIRKTLANMHSSRCAIIYLFFKKCLVFLPKAGLGARRVGLRVQTLLLATYVASNDCVHVRARYFTVYLKKYIMM